MKHILRLSLVLLLVPAFSFGQSANDSISKAGLNSTAQKPKPKSIANYIVSNTHYPDSAITAHIEGEVSVFFVIDETGNVESINVRKGLSGGCTEEVIHAINSLPKQEPYLKNGKPAKHRIVMDVSFRIKDGVGKVGIDSSKDVSLPFFPGGESAWLAYLGDNLDYPQIALKYKLEGKVIVSFVVNEDGSIIDAHIKRGIGGGCDEEALRLVKQMPKWIPAIQNGQPIKANFELPIGFSITEKPSDELYDYVEQMPQFPGKEEGLKKYISENLQYPKAAREQKLEGTVIITCIIDKGGNIVNARVRKSNMTEECNDEALWLVRNMPKWKPGKHRGFRVNVRYNIPVTFSL